ncbi:uncharacterized protein LOC114335932 isoform X2 [Diabrotica virgifera virgifera]|uniref:Uncharacterized protein n=1 Tax=Diabrotica virgifera virgifera TaxID=50390 RepID=A0ABM5IU60_DIAVI|nr:uncharacterized protein LOC114335932 isoform X2 [Diabrotica virgifera virgifera]
MKNLIFFLYAILVPSLNAIPVDVIQRNIPVEVRYDQILPGIVSREQVLMHGRRNLDAKVQLSSDELPQVLKHLPIPLESDLVPEIVSEEKVQVASEVENNAVKSLIQPEDQESVEVLPEKPIDLPIETLDSVLQETQNIIRVGLKNLRDSFKPNKGELGPTAEQWATLEKQVDEYFSEEKHKLAIRQSQPVEGGSTAAPVAQQPQNNWVQNIVNGINGIASNFVQSIQSIGSATSGGAQPPNGQADEGAAGAPPSNGFQGFVQFFNNGISNIVSTITGTNNNQPTTSNNNLSDPGSGATQAPGNVIGGFFGTIVSNVQNAFGIQPPPQGAQGDTGSQQQNGPVQVIQSVGNAISNFFGGNRPPSNSQGDEGASAQPGNSNIIQNIQNAIQNSPLNPFRPQNGQTQVNANPVQQAVQSIGTQVQQLIPTGGSGASPQPQPANPSGAKNPVSAQAGSEDLKPVEAVPVLEIEEPIKENEIVKKQLPLDVK